MLGRLEMDINCCIEMYLTLAQRSSEKDETQVLRHAEPSGTCTAPQGAVEIVLSVHVAILMLIFLGAKA